jgi:hypothetical protein
VNKRQIVLGGLAAVSGLATSLFAAGAAFAATVPASGLPLNNVTREAAGVTNLQMVSGLVPVAGAMPGLTGMAGAVSGMGLAGLNGNLARVLGTGSIVPGVSNETRVANLRNLTAGTSLTKGALSSVSSTVGSVRSVSSMTGGTSGLTGELPNVGSISGLLRGATSAVPTLGTFTSTLNAVK